MDMNTFESMARAIGRSFPMAIPDECRTCALKKRRLCGEAFLSLAPDASGDASR
jgi:hypothetical protein